MKSVVVLGILVLLNEILLDIEKRVFLNLGCMEVLFDLILCIFFEIYLRKYIIIKVKNLD